MSEETPVGWRRRSFFGGLLVAAGAAAGWTVRHFHLPQTRRSTGVASQGNRFAYDVSEFERTDPTSLLYEPAGEFPTRLNPPRRILDWPGHGIVVAGEHSLKIFDEAGEVIRQWGLINRPHCLTAMKGGRLLVGHAKYFSIFDSIGNEEFRSPAFGARTFLTSLAIHEKRAYAADAGNREVVICDLDSGSIIERFGKKDTARGNPGFNVPSPYFPLAIAPDNRLRVVNPGLLRIETYSLDGKFISSWGEPGMQIDRFCGCCNPVFFTMTSEGDFITSEKGLARIKIHGPDGGFKGVVAGPDHLVSDKELAKRACADCSIGAGFDVSITEEGDILALDPFRKSVHRFRKRFGSTA